MIKFMVDFKEKIKYNNIIKEINLINLYKKYQ